MGNFIATALISFRMLFIFFFYNIDNNYKALVDTLPNQVGMRHISDGTIVHKSFNISEF